MLQVVEGVDLGKVNWPPFLRPSQEVGLEEEDPTAGSVGLIQASLTTGVFSLTTGVSRGWLQCRGQTLRSTQATVRRAGPPCYNTWARRAICDNVTSRQPPAPVPIIKTEQIYPTLEYELS